MIFMGEDTRSIISLSIGVVFLTSSVSKLVHPVEFARHVADYEILPDRVAFVFGFCVIVIEIFLAVAHLSGLMLGLAVRLGIAVLSIFVVAITINLFRRRQLTCNCFGASADENISVLSLLRLALLIAGEWFLVLNVGPIFSVRSSVTGLLTGGPRGLFLTLTWVAFLLVVSMWILSAARFASLLRYRYRNLMADDGWIRTTFV
jgi:hypothetical protein